MNSDGEVEFKRIVQSELVSVYLDELVSKASSKEIIELVYSSDSDSMIFYISDYSKKKLDKIRLANQFTAEGIIIRMYIAGRNIENSPLVRFVQYIKGIEKRVSDWYIDILRNQIKFNLTPTKDSPTMLKLNVH